MKGIPAEDFIQHRVHVPVAEFDKGIQFAGVSGLLQQEFPEFFFPLFFFEPKPIPKLIEHQVDVHEIKVIGNELGCHSMSWN